MPGLQHRLGDKSWITYHGECLKALKALPADFASIVFCSPPYTLARTYGRDDVARRPQDWAAWMRKIVVESCRVSRIAFFNVSDVVDGFRYGGGPEMLVADLLRKDGIVMCRPYMWHKISEADDAQPNGTPGSGGAHFHRNDYEPIYGFCHPDKLGPKNPPKWSDNLAFGLPPKFSPGGQPRMRNRKGERQTQKDYTPPEISNPGNVLRVRVGGQGKKTKIASQGYAPMALGVAERFIRWFAAPGTIVLDPFCGTGTTLEAAVKHGRRGVGIDQDLAALKLTERRMRQCQTVLC